MATMNLSLPDPTTAWLEKQARREGFGDARDYVHELIRRDQERSSRLAAMQALVTQGLESGIDARSMEELREAGRMAARRGTGD